MPLAIPARSVPRGLAAPAAVPIGPPLPTDEPERLATLHALQLLDTPPEERFDRITRIARRCFDLPMAMIGLIDRDRQWFKSGVGLALPELPRAVAPCAHAIVGPDILVVPDTWGDARFAANPLVIGEPRLRFYAGCPLQAEGRRIGTLCLFGRSPRGFDDADRAALRDLAGIVEHELALHGQALRDDLTGLANQRGFRPRATQALAACYRRGRPAALMRLRLRSGHPPDAFGRVAVDETQRRFARLLRHVLRGSDVAARLGDDDFAALLTDADAASQAQTLRWLQIAASGAGASESALRFSVGVVACEGANPADLDALLAEADTAMADALRRADAHPPAAAATSR